MAEELYNRIINRINQEIETLKSDNSNSMNYDPGNVYSKMIEIGRCGTIKNIIDEEYDRLKD